MVMVVSVPYLVGAVIDDAIQADAGDQLGPMAALVIGAGVLLGIGIGVRRYFGFKLSYRAEADLRNRMFEHIQRLAFSFHDVTSTGELMARASSDLSQMRLVFAMLPITVANLGMFLAVVTVLIVLDPVLGLVSFADGADPAVGGPALRRRVIGLSFDVQQRLADLSQVVEEAIGGVQVIKSYGQEAQEQARLDRAAERIYRKAIRLAWIRSAYQPAFEMIPTMANLAVLWLGGMRVIGGDLTLGEFVAFTQYLAVLNFPLRITGWFFAQVPRAGAAAARIQSLLSTAPAIADPDPTRGVAGGSGRDPVLRRALRLSGWRGGPRRHRSGDPGRRFGRAGGCHRCRQDHPGLPGPALPRRR